MMDFSFSNESGSMSSASSCSKEMFGFYSAPTSPSRLKLREHTGFQTGPSTPRGYEADVNSNFNEFEFETSRRFNHSELGGTETNQKDVKVKPFDHKQEQQEQQRLCGDSLLPAMAFADELFCDGRVLPLIPPLKLPPRLLQKGDGNNLSTQSSTVTSPRSPGSVFRLPFSRHSLWNDDFDPFMVALEKVREEKRGKPKGNHGLRRSRSLSPLRSFNRSDKHVGLSHSHQPESHYCDTAQLICELQKEPLKQASEPKLKQASGKINMLSEPKGLVNDTNFEPKRTSVSKVAAETKKDEGQRGGGFWTRSKKREKIKRFLFGNANKDKASVQHKLLEDSKEALRKPTLLRKHDMKSVTSSTQRNKDETTTGELTKMRLAFHRQAIAKTFSLLGF